MYPSSRRRNSHWLRPVMLAAGLMLMGTGCGAGQLAQSAHAVPAIDGASGQVGSIALRNIGIAYPDGGRYDQGSSAPLEFAIVNGGTAADALIEIRTEAADRVVLNASGNAAGSSSASGPADTAGPSGSATPTGSTRPGGMANPHSSGASASSSPGETASPSAAESATANSPIAVPAGGYVAISASGPSATLEQLTASLTATQPVAVTFVFQQAGSVTVTIPVRAASTLVSTPPTIDLNPTDENG